MTTSIITTAHTELADALFGGRKSLLVGLTSARNALSLARANLWMVRALREPTGNPLDDWCRGEDVYRRRRSAALARVQRCRDAIKRLEQKASTQ